MVNGTYRSNEQFYKNRNNYVTETVTYQQLLRNRKLRIQTRFAACLSFILSAPFFFMLASFFWASDSSFSRLLDLSFLTSSLFFFFSFSFKAFTAFGLTLNPSLNHHYPLFIRLRTLFKPSSTIKSLIFQLIPTKSVMIQKRSLYCCIFLMKVGRQENADPLILHTSFFLFMFNSSVPPKMSIC